MKKLEFYLKNEESGKIQITHSRLLEFLAEAGYGRVKQGKSYVLAHEKNKQLRAVESSELSRYVQAKIRESGSSEVLEPFVRGVGNFLTTKKLDLLPEIELVSDMDSRNSSIFYFKNCYVIVDVKDLKSMSYNKLGHSIWENRLIKKKFRIEESSTEGDFEKFCKNVSGNDPDKFKRLMSILGYLLHRYKDPALTKAIIMYDENMHKSSGAEGGTGKTLFSQALSHCRDLITYNGKELKDGSWFKHQRINRTTDVVVYDDVPSNFKFENLFPILTTGIEVERKREHSFEIPFKESPKILISSNYYVKGPGGSSDRRRRNEFELANFYNDRFTPYDEFGKNFFEEWDFKEWNSFYLFMMKCVQVFLKEGLIEEDRSKSVKLSIEGKTSPQFYEFIEAFVEPGHTYDQRDYVETLQIDHPDLTSHLFTKWMKIYCAEQGFVFHNKSTGGEYIFWVTEIKE